MARVDSPVAGLLAWLVTKDGAMRRETRFAWALVLGLTVGNVHAFGWQDLWLTPDQQAQTMMDKGQFAKAQSLFQQTNWKAAAAWRAGDYQQAASLYSTLHNEQGYYNHGNALARLGKYADAIKAYDKALSINSSNQDAAYNRKLLEALLKKQEQKDNHSGDKATKDKNAENPQNQEAGEKTSHNKNEQNTDKKPAQGADAPSENSDNDKQKNKNSDKKDQPLPTAASQEDQEKEQAKQQWLKLIPDDPGGLLRQKFLRDHIQRQSGWNQ